MKNLQRGVRHRGRPKYPDGRPDQCTFIVNRKGQTYQCKNNKVPGFDRCKMHKLRAEDEKKNLYKSEYWHSLCKELLRQVQNCQLTLPASSGKVELSGIVLRFKSKVNI